MSVIANFYAAKNILITGPTEFLGLCLIEKILRSIPNVNKIYLLMVPTNGEDIASYLKDLTKNIVFQELCMLNQEVFEKLIPVCGDICENNLGLKQDDKKLLCENVQVVFHCASTSDFEENKKLAIVKNLLGTRRIMELCKQISRLQAVIHVSSLYANSFRTSSEEILYPPPGDAEQLIEMATADTSSLQSLDLLSFLGDHPNMNTFTKHLGEHEVATCALKIPCAIIRPSVVTGTWNEPIRGWPTSLEGPQGFLKGIYEGTTRRVLGPNNPMEMACVPVDVVANQLLVAGYKVGTDRGPLLIYHCTASSTNPFKWRQQGGYILDNIRLYPTQAGKWYPNLKVLPSLTQFRISEFYAHFIPAIIFDLIGLFMGKRPVFLSEQLTKSRFIRCHNKLMSTEFVIDNIKAVQLSQDLNDKDKEIFFLDTTTLEWVDYFKTLIVGIGMYLNDDKFIENLEAARSKQKILFIMDIALKGFRLCAIWFLVSYIFDAEMIYFIWLMPLFLAIFTHF